MMVARRSLPRRSTTASVSTSLLEPEGFIVGRR
jgi:hypothetical protein